tara:strand:+ start:1717 stop:2721 length:1005 start_codon:yes stop_codon:yes gene_type:complete
MKKKIDITVCILNYNNGEITKKCIQSLHDLTAGVSLEIIVVDNKSTDNSLEILNKINDIILIKAEYNCGFSMGCNLALRKASGKYSILLNNDTILKNNALKILFDFIELHPNAGAIGPQLYYFNNKKQFSYGPFRSVFERMKWEFGPELRRLISLIIPKIGIKKKEPEKQQEVKNYKIIGRPRGCAFMVKTSNMKKVGYLDEQFFIYCEETDWALRFLNKGFDNYFVGDAEIYHHWGLSTSVDKGLFDLIHTSSYYKYHKKHHGYKAEILLRCSFIFGASLNFLLFLIALFNKKLDKIDEFKKFKVKINKGFMFYEPIPEDTKKYLLQENKNFN